MYLMNVVSHSIYLLVLLALAVLLAVVNFEIYALGKPREAIGAYLDEAALIGYLLLIVVTFKACRWAWKCFRGNSSFSSAWPNWGLLTILLSVAVVLALQGYEIAHNGDGGSDFQSLIVHPPLFAALLLFLWMIVFVSYRYVVTRSSVDD